MLIPSCFQITVKKAPAEAAALKKAAAGRASLKKQRREEQERNVQRKKASASVGVADEADDTTLQSESEGIVEDGADDWGSDEDISEGSEEEEGSEESGGESPAPARKRRKP